MFEGWKIEDRGSRSGSSRRKGSGGWLTVDSKRGRKELRRRRVVGRVFFIVLQAVIWAAGALMASPGLVVPGQRTRNGGDKRMVNRKWLASKDKAGGLARRRARSY